MESPDPNQNHLLSNKFYDVLKNLALVVFPAIGTFYFVLAGIWGLPAAEQVVATIVAVDAFLGVIVKLGDASYNKSEARFDGDMVIQPSATGKFVHVELNKPPGEVADQDEAIFKIKNG